MKQSPLRLRIALLSTMLSGAVMILFGAAAWWTISSQKTAALDARIRALATRQPGWMTQQRDFQRLEDNIAYVLNTAEEATTHFLLIADPTADILHQSSTWPANLDAAPLTAPLADDPAAPHANTELTPSPGRGRGPGGGGGGPGGGGGGPGGYGHGGGGQPMYFTKVPEFSTLEAGGSTWRVGRLGNDRLTLVIGLNADATRSELRQLRKVGLIALPAALLLIASGGWIVAGRALQPLQHIADTASRVTARGLDQRVPDIGGDPEITRLCAMLNGMMDRLEAGFHQATRFSADASHELKTPLAIMRGEIEQAIASASPGSHEQRTLNSLLEETHRLGGIIRSLLLLSRADAGRLVTTHEPVDLTELLRELVEDATASAEIAGIPVKANLAAGIAVSGDASLLRTALLNLLGNAVKHSHADGRVTVDLIHQENGVRLEIANTAAAIPAEEREVIFERFARGRHARDAACEGTGLGLSLAREILTAHGGSLVLAEDRGDGLVRFVAMLPGCADCKA
jgi:two-component system, OmpR family, heavy metal sensor histidine kinase CusS